MLGCDAASWNQGKLLTSCNNILSSRRSRTIFGNALVSTNKFGNKLNAINQGVEKDGAFYLFSLRLIPVFPFFLINLLMGLAPMSVGRFYLTSQIGMLPGTAVYLNAGTQLATIESLSGIVSPAVLASFALLGLFPIITKWVMNKVRPTPSQQNS